MTRILLIDDEPIVRNLMAEILEEAGYEVTKAETAERALDLLETSDPSIVVSDVVMPGLSGLELLERVRERDRDSDSCLCHMSWAAPMSSRAG